MRIQLERLRAAIAAGMPRRGWKVGINVPEVQRQLGLTHAGVGWLDGSNILPSGGELHVPQTARLRVEPEICLRVAHGVAPDAPADAGRAAIAAVSPALEIVDYAQPSTSLDEVVGHSMFHCATVLGHECPVALASFDRREWPKLFVGARTAEPRPDLVPDDPGELVTFVAKFLTAFGESLQPDDLILSGAFTAQALRIDRGQEARGGFGWLGEVTVRIAGCAASTNP